MRLGCPPTTSKHLPVLTPYTLPPPPPPPPPPPKPSTLAGPLVHAPLPAPPNALLIFFPALHPLSGPDRLLAWRGWRRSPMEALVNSLKHTRTHTQHTHTCLKYPGEHPGADFAPSFHLSSLLGRAALLTPSFHPSSFSLSFSNHKHFSSMSISK